jgi:ABC-type Zn2+ transport system substrate-binding protein/surface adhesin
MAGLVALDLELCLLCREAVPTKEEEGEKEDDEVEEEKEDDEEKEEKEDDDEEEEAAAEAVYCAGLWSSLVTRREALSTWRMRAIPVDGLRRLGSHTHIDPSREPLANV